MRTRRILTRADVSPTLVSAGLWLLCVAVGLAVLLGATLAYADGGTAQDVATAAGGYSSTVGLGLVALTAWKLMGKLDKAVDERAIDRAAEAQARQAESEARKAEAEFRAAMLAHIARTDRHHTTEEKALDEIAAGLESVGPKRRPTGERLAELEDKLDRFMAGSESQPIHVARRQP